MFTLRFDRGLLFLSTPSARRATYLRRRCAGAAAISIHALREEGDVAMGISYNAQIEFLSTPSARRATPHPEPEGALRHISIHALREEGDKIWNYQ